VDRPPKFMTTLCQTPIHIVMGDTDDTTVHRGTKFSRYWYRRGSQYYWITYFWYSDTTSTAVCSMFQIFINNCYLFCFFFVPFRIAKYS